MEHVYVVQPLTSVLLLQLAIDVAFLFFSGCAFL